MSATFEGLDQETYVRLASSAVERLAKAVAALEAAPREPEGRAAFTGPLLAALRETKSDMDRALSCAREGDLEVAFNELIGLGCVERFIEKDLAAYGVVYRTPEVPR